MITRLLVWTNILIAGSAVGWVVVTLRALNLPLDGGLIVLAFILTLVFYTRDRLDGKERQADSIAMPERTAWVQHHAPLLKRIVWAGALSALGLAAIRPAAMPPLLAGLGLALTYTVRWLPWQGRRVGWKHLPGMKMPLVAALWTLVVVITPAAVYGQVWRRDTWLVAGGVCALVMTQILLNDVRDAEADRLNGTRSLPVVLGEPAARRVGYILAGLGALPALAVAPLPFVLTAVYSAILIWRYRRERDARWRGWIEAQGVVAGVAALV
jgi:hypothetical protein